MHGLMGVSIRRWLYFALSLFVSTPCVKPSSAENIFGGGGQGNRCVGFLRLPEVCLLD